MIVQKIHLILKPGTPAAAADTPSVSFKKSGSVVTTADFGTGIAGSASVWTIDVENEGKGPLKSPAVILEHNSATQFTISRNQLTGVIELKPGDSKSVDISFLPTAGPKTFTGALVVTGSNLSKPASLPLTGKS